MKNVTQINLENPYSHTKEGYEKIGELLEVAKSMGFIHLMTTSLSKQEYEKMYNDIDKEKRRKDEEFKEIEENKKEVISLCRLYISLISDDIGNNERLAEIFYKQYKWKNVFPFRIINRAINYHNQTPDEHNRFYLKKNNVAEYFNLWEQMPIHEAERKWVDWVKEKTKHLIKQK